MGNSETSGLGLKDKILIIVLCVLVGGFVVNKFFMDNGADTGQDSAEQQSRDIPVQGKIAAVRNYLADNPDAASWWAELGNLYVADGQLIEALAAYEKTLQLNPADAALWQKVGVMYRKVQKPKQAVAAFDRAITLQPDLESALFDKGSVLLYDLKDKVAALAVWEELLAVNPQAKSPNGVLLKDMVSQLKVGIH